jgi:hypothetical protein
MKQLVLVLLLTLPFAAGAREGFIYVEDAIEAASVQLRDNGLWVSSCSECPEQRFALDDDFVVRSGGEILSRDVLRIKGPGVVIYDTETRKAKRVQK